MNAIFADASYYVALVVPRDAFHGKAIQLSQSTTAKVVTTEFVLVEVANFLCRLERRVAGIQLMRHLHGDAATEIVPASSELVRRGFELFEQRTDKEWSLTDCISFVVMEERGVRDALTSDAHFEQAGCRALML